MMDLTPAQKIFSALTGLWALDREIPGQGTLTGTVKFTQQEDGRLLCEENGKLRLDAASAPINSFRSYIYESLPDRIVIYYNDPARSGEVLHELVFSEEEQALVSRHCHVCTPDTYALHFRYAADGQITMDYQVRGPHKNYDIHSVLKPQP